MLLLMLVLMVVVVVDWVMQLLLLLLMSTANVHHRVGIVMCVAAVQHEMRGTSKISTTGCT